MSARSAFADQRQQRLAVDRLGGAGVVVPLERQGLFDAGLTGAQLEQLLAGLDQLAAQADDLVALALPKFVAFAVVPIGFCVMGLRFFAQMLESFAGRVEEDDALHMLGLQTDAHDPAHAHVAGEEDAV